MSTRSAIAVGLLLGCFGCGAQSDKPKNAGETAKPTADKQAPEAPKPAPENPKVAGDGPIKIVAYEAPIDDVEGDVRATIAKRLKVDPAAIDMNKKISEPPLNADENQLREIVTALEGQRKIEISEFAIAAFIAKGPCGTGMAQISPAELAALVRLAPKVYASQLKKANPPDGK